jgi:site-specific recombinase XerD
LSKQPVAMSLQGCLELFIDRCENENLSPATIQYYKFNIGSFIRYLRDEHRLENPITSDYKVEYLNGYLAKARKRNKWEEHSYIKTKEVKLGSQSIRTYTRALRTFGNWMFREGFIEDNILEKLKLPKASDKMKEILNDDEIEKIMDSFNAKTELGLRNSIIFTLAYDLGVREGGIANLRVMDVDFKAMSARVQLKGGNITILPISKTLAKQVREYIVKYRGFGKDEEPLLVSYTGGKLTGNAIKKVFTKLKQTTGIQRVNCHLGRHTFSTNYVSEGKHNCKELQLALAHESDTMSKKYVNLAQKITYIRRGADSHFEEMNEKKKGIKGPLHITGSRANMVLT